MSDTTMIEQVSARVHENWMAAKRAAGVTTRLLESGEELMVPYDQLSEAAKELDRGTVRTVLAVLPDLADLTAKAAAYDRINTPEIHDFLSAVENEALHQRERWGVDKDGGKSDAEWYWLVGYLAGKALHDVKGKRLHHIITASAALLNWHAHALGAYARMRPGIEPPAEESAA